MLDEKKSLRALYQYVNDTGRLKPIFGAIPEVEEEEEDDDTVGG